MHAFDVCALVIFSMLLVNSVVNDRIRTSQVTNYRMICGCAGAVTVFELAKLLILESGRISGNTLLLLNIVTTLYFLFHMLTCVFVLRLVLALILIRLRGEFSSWGYVAVISPYVLSVLITLINIKTGILFFYEATGDGFIYHRGPCMVMYYVLAMAYVISAVGALWLYKVSVSKNMRGTLYAYFGCFFIGLLLQTFVNGLYVEQFFLSVSCFLVYITIQRTDEYMDSESGALSRFLFLSNATSYLTIKRPFTFICVKIDNDKFIEESIGSDMEGEFPRKTALYLKGFAKDADVFRYKEDMYMLLLRKKNPDTALRIMREMAEHFKEPWKTGEFVVKPEVAMWQMSYPEDFEDTMTMIRKVGFTSDPENHKGEVIIDANRLGFDEDEHRRHLEERIFTELSANLLEIVPMTIVRSGDHKVSGYVPRLLMMDRGIGNRELFPSDLQSKNVKNLDKVDMYILEDVCAKLSGSFGERDTKPMAIRVSKDFLLSSGLIENIRNLEHTYGIESRLIMLGVSDNVYSSMSDDEKKRVKEISENGVRLFLYSFGIGYSKLASLLDSPFESVSVGYRVMVEARVNPALRTALGAVTDALHSAGKNVMAFGVDDDESEMIAEQYGADYLCGKLYDRGEVA
ncbi:MAG: EAL domain-containing protein [Lachnospiraceae bacterium]|nr:EAL domain-containing protein [Lachnospiraceae bacterium]